MIISVHQPQYLPWLGYFDKIARSDHFVFLDNVQYKEREFQNRNKIRVARGWLWLTVPVVSQGEGRQNISEVRIDNEVPWQRKHLGSLKTAYANAPYFKEYFSFMKDVLSREWLLLKDLNVEIVNCFLKELSISTAISFESDLGITTTRTQRIVDICKKLKADIYLSGAGGKKYLDEELFADEGLKLLYQDFKHPQYRQCFEPFEPYMSVIDLLFNHGKKAREILLHRDNS